MHAGRAFVAVPPILPRREQRTLSKHCILHIQIDLIFMILTWDPGQIPKSFRCLPEGPQAPFGKLQFMHAGRAFVAVPLILRRRGQCTSTKPCNFHIQIE